MRQLVLLVLLGAAYGDYTGHRLLSIDATSAEHVKLLHELSENPMFDGLDFWTEPVINKPTDVRVTPHDFGKLQGILRGARISFQVKQENVQELIDNERMSMAKVPKNALCDIYKTYCSLSQAEEWLKNKELDNWDNMELGELNRYTSEGNVIYYAKIAEDLNNPKPAIWIEAGTHAREWIAVSSGLALIDKLLDFYDPFAQDMLRYFDWYIVPIHNPDGYVFTHEGERLWRKNMQECGSWLHRGTDLNRNWDSQFGGVGASANCRDSTYHGPGAFSAPETAALRDAVLGTKDVRAFFSIHCYSQVMLVPFGYTDSVRPQKDAELRRVGELMMDALKDVDGRTFETGTPHQTIGYSASGGAYDYFYEQGIPYSYTYELRPERGTSNGFVLATSEIEAATEEVFASLHAFAVDPYLDFTSEFN